MIIMCMRCFHTFIASLSYSTIFNYIHEASYSAYMKKLSYFVYLVLRVLICKTELEIQAPFLFENTFIIPLVGECSEDKEDILQPYL